jgi:nucleoside-diphosphate-sugar epimerase
MRFDNVLVTGAGGLLGSYVVDELRSRCDVSGFDLKPPKAPIRHAVGDITDYDAVAAACKGRDAVVHIAAMPNIWSGTGQRIMHTNVMGAWNVLQAAEEAGVRRVVLCSSDSVVGFTVLSGAMRPPDYLPIDHRHSLRPTDPYALSKLLGEEAGRSFAERGRLEVVALRPVFVLYPEMEGEVRARAQDPANYRGPAVGGPSAAGGGAAWHYVDPRDAARAFRLALELDEVRFDAFFISAANTLAPEPTLARLRARLEHLPAVRRPEVYRDNPHAPLYDLAHARDELGFVPAFDRRDIVAGIVPGGAER